jgi:hypothetical protein
MAITDRRGVSVDATDTAIAGSPNPGLAIKAPCRAATTANIVLSGLLTIDGIALLAGNRVLVKNQTNATQNGIYNASTGNWTRAIDAASNDQWANGTVVYVALGTANADKSYVLTTLDPVTIGASSLTFLFLASSGVPANRAVNTTAPIAGGGALTGDLTLSLTINGSLQVTAGNALAVAALNAVSHQWVSSFNASGVPQLTQPGFSDLSGNATAAQGGTGRTTLTAHAVLLGEGTSNVAFATIGTAGQLLVDQGAGADPAFTAMSGDATISNAGALTIGTNAVTNAKAAQMAAGTLKGNNTGGTANAADLTVAQAQGLLSLGIVVVKLSQVSLASAATDHALAFTLPAGFTRFRVSTIALSNATGDIHTGTIGVFGATGGGAPTLAADQAIAVTTAAANTNGNAMLLALTNQNTEFFTPASFGVANTLWVRVGTAVAAQSVDVVVYLQLVP